MRLSIIIPTRNGKHLLEESLPLLEQARTNCPDSEVLIIDNGSSDSTHQYITSAYPDYRLIQLPSNQGFTGAVNAGIHAAEGEYCCLLNNDCHLADDTLSILVSFLDQSHHAATQPIIRTPEGAIENIGFLLDLKRAKASTVTDIDSLPTVENNMDWNNNISRFYGLTAACLVVRSTAFKQAGSLDDAFHSYLEDIDLMIRFAKHSLSYAPCLQASVTHKHMATSSTMGSYKRYRDFQNWLRIIYKHYSLTQMIRFFPSLAIERLRNLNGIVKSWYN